LTKLAAARRHVVAKKAINHGILVVRERLKQVAYLDKPLRRQTTD